MRTLEEVMSELPPERRKEIEATKVLIAEEMARQKRRKARKAKTAKKAG